MINDQSFKLRLLQRICLKGMCTASHGRMSLYFWGYELATRDNWVISLLCRTYFLRVPFGFGAASEGIAYFHYFIGYLIAKISSRDGVKKSKIWFSQVHRSHLAVRILSCGRCEKEGLSFDLVH